MKLEVKIQVLKFCSAVFNSIFLVLGLAVVGCAVWILFDGESLLNVIATVELRTVGAGLLVIGGVVVVVSAVGCVGAAGENRFLLLTYLVFLIVLVLGQLFVTLLLLINRDKVKENLDQIVDQIIRHYGNHGNSQDRLMDSVQRLGECCGRKGPADWLNNSYIQSLNLTSPDVLPCSCFRNVSVPETGTRKRLSINLSWCSELLNFSAPLYGRGNNSYDQGCEKRFSAWLQENALTIIGMDFALILIQVVQFVVTVYLYRAFGRKVALKRTDPLADTGHAHLNHTPEEDLDYGEQNYGYIDLDDGYIDHAHPAHFHDYPNLVDPTHPAYHRDNQNHT